MDPLRYWDILAGENFLPEHFFLFSSFKSTRIITISWIWSMRRNKRGWGWLLKFARYSVHAYIYIYIYILFHFLAWFTDEDNARALEHNNVDDKLNSSLRARLAVKFVCSLFLLREIPKLSGYSLKKKSLLFLSGALRELNVAVFRMF